MAKVISVNQDEHTPLTQALQNCFKGCKVDHFQQQEHQVTTIRLHVPSFWINIPVLETMPPSQKEIGLVVEALGEAVVNRIVNNKP